MNKRKESFIDQKQQQQYGDSDAVLVYFLGELSMKFLTTTIRVMRGLESVRVDEDIRLMWARTTSVSTVDAPVSLVCRLENIRANV